MVVWRSAGLTLPLSQAIKLASRSLPQNRRVLVAVRTLNLAAIGGQGYSANVTA